MGESANKNDIQNCALFFLCVSCVSLSLILALMSQDLKDKKTEIDNGNTEIDNIKENTEIENTKRNILTEKTDKLKEFKVVNKENRPL